MIDVGLTLLFIFFGVFQIYILMFGGMKYFVKKYLNSQGLALVNSLVYYFYIPIYSMIEISRMATIANIKSYWLVFVSVILALTLRLAISKLVNILFKFNLKTSDSYLLINTFPAVGSLTLVIGKALCYNGCPLYGDPQCDNILGLMMVNYLIYSIYVYVSGFIIHSNSYTKYTLLKEKLKYVIYRFLILTSREDVLPRYFIEKLVCPKSDINTDQLHKDFISKHKLLVDEEFSYSYVNTEMPNEVELGQKKPKAKTMILKNENKATEPIPVEVEVRQKDEYLPQELNDIKKNYFENSSMIEEDHFNHNQVKEVNIMVSDGKELLKNLSGYHHKLQKKQSTIILKVNLEKKKSELIGLANFAEFMNKSKKFQNTFILKKLHEYRNEAFKIITKANKSTVNFMKITDVKRANSFSYPKAKSVIPEEGEFNANNKGEIIKYFTELFNLIQANIETSYSDEHERQKHLSHLDIERNRFFSDINDNEIPSFKTLDSDHISEDDLVLIDQIWTDFETNFLEKNNLTVSLIVESINISFNFIFKKLISAPLLGMYIGLFIGMSDLRSIPFGTNHYWLNIFEPIFICGKAYVPLLFVIIGYAITQSPKFNNNFSLTKLQIIINMVLFYLIYPLIGLGILAIWKNYVSGISQISKALRFTMYVPFAVALSPNFVLVINLVNKFYLDEYTYALSKHLIVMMFAMTIILLVYFLIIN